jgi:ubiquinone biosynthesis protein COQ4
MARAYGATIKAIKALGQSIGAFGHLLGIFFDPKKRFKHGQRFLEFMDGHSFDVVRAAFESHPSGRALLEALPDTAHILTDRVALSQRPVGSFGRSYLDFLVSNGLDAADYAAIVQEDAVRFSTDVKLMWLRNRIGGNHDVRHVLTGYGSDQLGEACLLAFRAGQIGHRGAGILAAVMSIVCTFIHGPAGTLKAVTEAYRRGRSATLVDLCPFEFDLSEPLESCRMKLGLTPPGAYQAALELRSGRKFWKRSPAEPVGQEPSVW